MLFERDCETRGYAESFTVNGLDTDCQDLGSFVRLLVAVKTDRLPLEIQVALVVPFILLKVGNARVRARSRCEISVPLLRQIDSIQCYVRGATSMFLGVTFEVQDLRK